jgi:hypothetical protein
MISTMKLFFVLDADVITALADDDGDGEPDSGVLEAALAAAEAQVRADASRGGFPAEDELPELLEDLAVTLAVERLFERRRELSPGAWSVRADRARALLAAIAAGEHPLPGARRRRAVQHAPANEQPPLQRLPTMKGL